MMLSDTILLVEDNRDDETLTISALRDASIRNRIDVARDGVDALDYLFKRGAHANVETPQLVLLDLELPKVDGIEVLREIRANPITRAIPVVIFASSKEESDLIRSYELGVNSYIQKPIDFADFAKAVSQVGLYWLVLNQRPTT
jgi:two-component system, response regulator